MQIVRTALMWLVIVMLAESFWAKLRGRKLSPERRRRRHRIQYFLIFLYLLLMIPQLVSLVKHPPHP